MLTYIIDEDAKLVYATLSGETDLEERKSFLDQLVADPDYTEKYNILYDQRECTNNLTTEEQIELVTYTGRHYEKLNGIRMAVLSEESRRSVLTRMADTLQGGAGIHTAPFKTYEEAISWLKEQ